MANTSTSENRSNISPKQVGIIRIALFSGVTIFGIVAWAIRMDQPASSSESDMEGLVYGFIALVALAIVVALAMRSRMQQAGSFAQRFPLALAGWAVCESTALLGGVYFILTGNPLLYVGGALLLLASFFVVVPRPD